MRNFIFICVCWLLLASQLFAGIKYYTTAGGGATAYYALVESPVGTFHGYQLPEGTGGAVGLYSIADAAMTSGGMTNVDGDYDFRIFAGVAADIPTGACLGSGTLGWTGAAERPLRTNVEYWKGIVIAAPATAGLPDVNTKKIGNTTQTGGNVVDLLTTISDAVVDVSVSVTNVDSRVILVKAITDKLDAMIEFVSSHNRFKSTALEQASGSGSIISADIKKIDGSENAAKKLRLEKESP